MVLTYEQKIQVVVAHKDAGVRTGKIAKKFNISASTIQFVIKHHKERGTVTRQKGSARKQLFGERDIRQLGVSLRKIARKLLMT
jgi:transposase